MHRNTLALSLLGISALSACTDTKLNTVPTPTTTTLVYSPSQGDIPLPNDILFSGTVDATLNFPPALDEFGDPDPGKQSLFDSLNSLDGWSTTAPMAFHFDYEIDAGTVLAGEHGTRVRSRNRRQPVDDSNDWNTRHKCGERALFARGLCIGTDLRV